MQNKTKILMCAVALLVGGIVHTVSAVSIDSTEVVVSDRTLVTTVTGMPAWFDGNVCPTEVLGSEPSMTYCPSATGNYSDTTILDGVSLGTTNVACLGSNASILACEHMVTKESVSTCTYATNVVTWGTCSASGVQYATGYDYATVEGSDCTDMAPRYQYCAPAVALTADCPYEGSAESPVVHINTDLSREIDTSTIRVLKFNNPSITVNQPLDAGTYSVETVSYDGYSSRLKVIPQQYEQWSVEFLSGGAVIGTVGPTTDIIDNVVEDHRYNTFSEITLTSDVSSVRLVHVPENIGHSVVPVCIKFTREDVPATTVPDPTLTFSAVPDKIAPGDTATLTWTPKNADTCEATGGDGTDSWPGTKLAIADTEVVSPTEDTTYYLECKNSEGKTTGKRTAKVYVLEDLGVPLSVKITANPGSGAPVGTTVRWTATASGGKPPYQSFVWSGAVSGSGTYPIPELTNLNYIEKLLTEKGDFEVRVKVTDAEGDEANDTYTTTIVDDRNPQ